MTERRYQLTKIAPGDWLLPSNDGTTLWRITRYTEHGDSQVSADGKTWKPLRGDYWQTARYNQPTANGLDHNFLDWHRWDSWETLLPTRQAAIDACLR